MFFYSIGNACSSSQQECCKGTTLSCCSKLGTDAKGNQLSYDLSACSLTLDKPIIIDPIESIGCSTSGQTQYQPKGDCGTSTRTCCSDGIWSGWDEECSAGSSTCSSYTKPASSQQCTLAGGANGTQTRTVTCDTSTGNWNTGNWSACACEKTCPSAQVKDNGTCQCCDLGCYLFKSNYGQQHCNCVANSYALDKTCCSMINGDEYHLPASYSSCSSFANDMGLSLNKSVQAHACALY